jgi:L-aspartate oxidase
MGQVFSSTTNPSVSTGDGVALALRAGAAVADLEFVQFHPTSLFLGPGASGQQPLVSEALRGEGAFLSTQGRAGHHDGRPPARRPRPRDVVAKADHPADARAGVDHVCSTPATSGGPAAAPLPDIVARCREAASTR